MVDRICLYTSPFITRNQEIKTLEKLNQAIKQASRDESSDQAPISTIKILDRRHSWKYRAHSSDYPLFGEVFNLANWRFSGKSPNLKSADIISCTIAESLGTRLYCSMRRRLQLPNLKSANAF